MNAIKSYASRHLNKANLDGDRVNILRAVISCVIIHLIIKLKAKMMLKKYALLIKGALYPINKLLRYALPIMMLSMDCFARAGGGGGGGGGGHGGGKDGIFWIIVIILLQPFIMTYKWYVNSRLNSKQASVQRVLIERMKTEPKWAEEKLLEKAKQRFFELQQAWGKQDLLTMKKLLHPMLYPSWHAQIKLQISQYKKNIMLGLVIRKIRIMDACDDIDHEGDFFTVCIDAWADDQTLNHGVIMDSKESDFREFWTFKWHENDWVLLEIYQSAAWKKFVLR